MVHESGLSRGGRERPAKRFPGARAGIFAPRALASGSERRLDGVTGAGIVVDACSRTGPRR